MPRSSLWQCLRCFTSSRHLITGPDASVAALGAALFGLALPDDPMRRIMPWRWRFCGGLFLMFWLFRLAFLANFLSRPVMAGFVTGLAIEVLVNQVRKILGAPHVDGAGPSGLPRTAHEVMAASLGHDRVLP